jgi:hypothetical protein
LGVQLPKPHYLINGGIAQLGERLHGMQEVSGSIPLVSTNLFNNLSGGTKVVKVPLQPMSNQP